ncbi:flavin-binding monooxygenase-like protein [Rhodococcus sp. AG1013]|nr:flavin-binding monooxygenase-like protein [Rhodococcus sp. AG1013]
MCGEGRGIRMDRVCIVGAGPAGLSAARAFRRLGIEYDQFERHSDVGGIWDLDNPGTPMYESAHFISSRTMSGFHDFPMPDSFPDYPGNRAILDYTRSFARAFGLYESIGFGTAVEDITPDGDGWAVRLSTGERRRYRAVVCATGVTWQPRIPAHPGTFDGEIRHAVTYRGIDEFRGKRVLIVGLGNSGADIACDAAASASETFVSVRRGYHVIPKHIFGTPTDVFAEKGPRLPIALERPLLTGVLRLIQGDLTRLGLPRPDHKLLESHPLLNSQLVHHLQHGDVAIVPDVARFAGPRVEFTDGSSREVDLVLYATGYDWTIPYVRESCFDWHAGRPRLYLTAFNPKHRNLFGAGYLETNSSAYTLFDQVTNILAQYLHDQEHNPSRAAVFDRRMATDRPDLSGGISFIGTDRHSAYVDSHALRDYLARVRGEFGWTDLTPGMFDRVRVAA